LLMGRFLRGSSVRIRLMGKVRCSWAMAVLWRESGDLTNLFSCFDNFLDLFILWGFWETYVVYLYTIMDFRSV
jgi:hypothetical protein